MRPLALTPGEPAGIGPELAVMAAQRAWPAPIVAFADPELLRQRARLLALPLRLLPAARPPEVPAAAGELYVHPVPLRTGSAPGELAPANAGYVLETLRGAANACLDGSFAALVTAPVHKGVINDAGIPFSGHTEFLAELSGGSPVMLLACPGLRVALATTHLPLREVADALSRDGLERVIRILDQDLRVRFGIERPPRILVCGLNPHAGEGGHLGREEIEIIEPVLAELRARGLALTGPLPADTAFTPPRLAQADAVLAMYHDQGLPVLKHLGFGDAVNVTLGLPLIRTSVDHGTALDLAGQGEADPRSLFAAIDTAIELSGR